MTSTQALQDTTATTQDNQAPTLTPELTIAPTQKLTTAPTPTIDQQINQIVQNAGMSGKNIKSMYNVGGDNYEKVQEDPGDGNLTNGLTVTEIHMHHFYYNRSISLTRTLPHDGSLYHFSPISECAAIAG